MPHPGAPAGGRDAGAVCRLKGAVALNAAATLGLELVVRDPPPGGAERGLMATGERRLQAQANTRNAPGRARAAPESGPSPAGAPGCVRIFSMAEATLFEKIIRREIPADIVHEDELCVAFRDVNPQAPVHVLVVPRKPLDRAANAVAEDGPMLGHLLLTAGKIAAELGCAEAYRLVVNNGAGAGQSVFHLHVHLLGGRPFGWPPG